MDKKLLVYWLICMPLLAYSQLSDNFTDGDFAKNPAWTGDVTQFTVNNSFQLQLNSTGDNTACLAIPNNFTDSLEWSFWVRLAFSPSDNNCTRIYLCSDNPDLKGALNGYYLRLGENGSNDAIELLKQSGTVSSLVCRGTNGLLASSFAIRIKVLYTAPGNWKIYSDASGGANYLPEASGFENTISSGSWFGVVCKYTSSNSTRFYFDDFLVSKLVADKTPPQISGIKVVSSTNLDVLFSEIVEVASAVNTANYSVDKGVSGPFSAMPDAADRTVVHLSFKPGLTNDVNYTLFVSNIKDIAGNCMQSSQTAFSYHIVKPWDVLINEIMADPDPPVGLPNEEFIELYNRSAFDIDLTDWTLTFGSSRKVLPKIIIPAKEYLLISDLTAINLFGSFGPCIGLPGFTLTNTGSVLILSNISGQVIHSVSYAASWYKNEFKKEGGWSLGMTDPQNPCGEAANWAASIDAKGGTPGKANTIIANNPDKVLPAAIRVGVPDAMHVELLFNEPMDSTTLLSVASYTISPMGNPLAVKLMAPDYRKVVLLLAQNLLPDKVFTLSIAGNIADCAGNKIPQNSTIRVAMPSLIQRNDVIINEILFDTKEGCPDFVEIYNRSLKVLDLKDFLLADYDTLTKEVSNMSEISKQSWLIFPGDYYALTTDTAMLKQFYFTGNPNGFIQLGRLPAMNNESGCLALTTPGGTVIDYFAYDAGMQYPLLTSTDGVSLERINPDIPANLRQNWHSAAGTAGFATPASINSQFAEPGNQDGEAISLSPGIFSPDDDGHSDVLTIAYAFAEPGYNATVTVYDALGSLVRNLVTNELLGVSGAFVWDGLTNDRQKALIGRYIVWVEVFNLNGNVKRYKKTTVLVGKI